MRVSTEAYLRAKERKRIYEKLDIEEQLELPNFPPPMTANRARDFAKECKKCQVACDYCIPATGHMNMDFDPLGR